MEFRSLRERAESLRKRLLGMVQKRMGKNLVVVICSYLCGKRTRNVKCKKDHFCPLRADCFRIRVTIRSGKG